MICFFLIMCILIIDLFLESKLLELQLKIAYKASKSFKDKASQCIALMPIYFPIYSHKLRCKNISYGYYNL